MPAPRSAIRTQPNLGKNKDTPAEKAHQDYLAAFEALSEVGDYFVVNVSSPNTPGLRDLQAPEALRSILRPLVAAAKTRGSKPILLKLAPDLADEDIDALSDLALAEGLAGLVLANTTIGRLTAEDEPLAKEAGGMSGAPLLPRALALVARVYRRHGERLPIIGVGGVFSALDAWQMLRAGAVLVQAYTGFIYQGPAFAKGVQRGLIAALEREELSSLSQAVGRDARERRLV